MLKAHEVEYTIHARLKEIEEREHIYVPFACESGSRAWGFASQDSDYDMRGIYVRPVDAYMRLSTPRDVVEDMQSAKVEQESYSEGDSPTIQMDVHLWDVFKALRLLSKLNPQMIEWFHTRSYDVYCDDLRSIRSALCRVSAHNLRSSALFYHYRSMARSNYMQYIHNPAERGEHVQTKKYLYVLRPLSVLLYIKEHGMYPPADFEAAFQTIPVDDAVRDAVTDLLTQKRRGFETDKAKPNLVLNAWIDDMLSNTLVSEQYVEQNANNTGRLVTLCEEVLTYALALSKEHFG